MDYYHICFEKKLDDMQPRVLRSSQLDSHELDTELGTLFKEKIGDIFKMIPLTNYDAEMKALLDLMVNATIISNGATYGMMLQNLVYRHKNPIVLKNRLRILLFVKVIGQYIVSRFSLFMLDNSWSESPISSYKFQIWHYLNQLQKVYDTISLGQFVLFLYNGRYPTFLEQLLGLRLEYKEKFMSRVISYEYMNRQLVLQTLTEFAVTALRLINLNSFFQKNQHGLPEHVCAFCALDKSDTEIHIPFITNCGHVFCYYCLESKRMTHGSLKCPRCNTLITDTKPAP
jgi:peroxin-2